MSPSFILRVPGLRRYAFEIERLRRRLASADARVAGLKRIMKEQQARARERSRLLHHRDEELQAMREELARTAAAVDASGTREEKLLRRAMWFDYYWYNAAKKIDLRELDTFGPLALRVRRHGRTFLHLDRLYTLWQAVAGLPPLAEAVAEIGTYRGGSARFIAEAMRAHGRELPFYVCDTFRGHVVVDETVDGRHAVRKQFASAKAHRVAHYLRPFRTVRVVDGDIRETSARLEDERRFGLVHIDVDVYPITRFCLEFFVPRVVDGGTIVVDDYGLTTCRGVKKAVDEFVAANREFRMLHLLTGQAVLIPPVRGRLGLA